MRSRVFTLLLVAACGDNLTGIPLDEVDQARQDAECSRLLRCGLFADATVCDAYFRPRNHDSRNAAVRAGSIRYNGVAAERCFAWLAESSCDATSSSARFPPRDCDGIFVGTMALGTSCYLDTECESGVCDQPTCSRDMCCGGVCGLPRQRHTVDSACADDRDCTRGTYCGGNQTCQRLEAAGGPCFNDSQCADQLACIGPGVDPGTCRPLPLLGESCPYLRCAEIGALCSGSQVCVSSGPGAACSGDAECSFFGLCDGTRDVCGPVPTLGQPCVTRCSGESWCDRRGPEPICAAPLETMAACMTDEACESRLCEEGPIFDYCAAAPLCF